MKVQRLEDAGGVWMDLEAAELEMFFVNIAMVGEEEPANPEHVAQKEWEEATRIEQGEPPGQRMMDVVAGVEGVRRVS
jgi:hypothetical protein